MRLYLIRHAQAVELSPDLTDAERPLTPEGRDRWRRSVRGLGRWGMRFDALIHSPWLRAVQTAHELGRLVDGESMATPLLVQSPGEPLLESLRGDRVAVVGHQPWLGELLGLLVHGRPESGSSFLLKKGSLVCLEGEARAGQMTVRSILPPKMLRHLGA